ncbi:MAG: GGDEF and EAL domain-containing protein [Lachnospiraceae bacterium]|nr:GGDEF and EAL domain-containing protein [Lachnospiraceae bacterium]
MEKNKHDSIDKFLEVINIFNPCIDDYLYILDFRNDFYYISPNAIERFNLSENQFYNVNIKLKELVYPADFELLLKDMEQLLNKEKDFHNLQYRWMDKNGEPVWINCRGKVLMTAEGEPEFLVGCINEIGCKQKADNVSGLLGESSLQNELKAADGERLSGFILRLGIDDFKEINENRGMDYGDMVLKRTAECIQTVIGPNQKLYRIVADEFVVIDLNGGRVEDAVQLYKDIQGRIDGFIEENRYEVFYTISAGILNFSAVDDQSYYNLMRYAEFSLNEAKNGGKNKYYIYSQIDYDLFQRKKDIIHIMRQAVNHDFEGFEAYFQPIMDINKNRLFSAETLLRFRTPETGVITPGEFIPLLEESNLIIPVGKWVLYQAMEACSKIQKKVPDFRISVNLSYIQVLKSNILEDILSGIEKYQLKKGSILIELTESGFLESNTFFLSFCEGLKENGIPLALDDFGTGYSNFHYLYNLNPSTIKIDRSFTMKALSNSYEYNLLQHMIDMTHSIDLKLCVEGIETKQELNKICEMGPDYIQGFYFGKPYPLEQFMADFVNE